MRAWSRTFPVLELLLVPSDLVLFCPQLWPGTPSTKVCLLVEVLTAPCSSGTLGNHHRSGPVCTSAGGTGSGVDGCASQGGEGGWRDGDGSRRDDLELSLAPAWSHPLLGLQRPHQVGNASRSEPPGPLSFTEADLLEGEGGSTSRVRLQTGSRHSHVFLVLFQ